MEPESRNLTSEDRVLVGDGEDVLLRQLPKAGGSGSVLTIDGPGLCIPLNFDRGTDGIVHGRLGE